MKSTLSIFFRRLRTALLGDLITSNKQLHDLQLLTYQQSLRNAAANPLNKSGEKYFSQFEEDGITLEILRRIEVKTGTFAEFGVGDGSENNTLILLASGYRGFWVGGEDLFFHCESARPRFAFLKRWIDRDNALIHLREGLDLIGSTELDVVSLDLDGNDIYVAEAILQNQTKPKLFIVEYNAKFPPPIRWMIEYDKDHHWGGDDYFGASLSSFNDLFAKHDYTLICCNCSGVNAFFIRNDFLHYFEDVPKDIGKLFFAPRYYLFKSYGHTPSARTIERMLRSTGRI